MIKNIWKWNTKKSKGKMFSLRFSKIANRSNSVHNSILQPHENVKTQQHIYTQNTHTYAHDVVWNYNARSIWMYGDVLGWFNVVFLHGVPIRNSVKFKARGTHTRDIPTYARLLKKFVHRVDASLKYMPFRVLRSQRYLIGLVFCVATQMAP